MSIDSNFSFPAIPLSNISDSAPAKDTLNYKLLTILGGVAIVAIVAFVILYAWCDVLLEYLFQSSDSESSVSSDFSSSCDSSSCSDDGSASSLGLNRMFYIEEEHDGDDHDDDHVVRELKKEPPPDYLSVMLEDPKEDEDQPARPRLKFAFLWQNNNSREEVASEPSPPPSYSNYIAKQTRSV